VGDDREDESHYNRRNGDRALRDHQANPYAHGELVGRLQHEGLNIRERFENRLNALERFRAQATLIGGVALVLLGALAAAIFPHVIH
jgi:hypothetical protein